MKNKYFILTAILVGCLLICGIWLILNYHSTDKGSDVESHQQNAGPKVSPSDKSSSENYENNRSGSLSSDKESTLSEQLSPVPDEFKHLRLVGTASNTDKQPYAVIDNTKTNTQGLYKQGDQIDGATIIRIQSNEVILTVNGKTFKLILEKVGSVDKQLSTDNLLQETPDPFVHTTQEDVEKAWDDTQNLMTQIELEQYLDNGEPNGVKIERVSPESVFEKIGFKPGDILVAVDDMKMSIADDAMEVYNCIRTKPAVKFTIIREGESAPLILEYNSQMTQQ